MRTPPEGAQHCRDSCKHGHLCIRLLWQLDVSLESMSLIFLTQVCSSKLFVTSAHQLWECFTRPLGGVPPPPHSPGALLGVSVQKAGKALRKECSPYPGLGRHDSVWRRGAMGTFGCSQQVLGLRQSCSSQGPGEVGGRCEWGAGSGKAILCPAGEEDLCPRSQKV